MKQSFLVLLLALGLGACRDYDLSSRLTDQSGLIPPDQFARYGREQAQEIAIARQYGQALDGSSYANLARGADAATSYARTLPNVNDASTDPLGFRVTIRFASGWLTAITPVDDGKRGAETRGLPADSPPATAR